MRVRALTPLLPVADVAASLAWYARLGFEELDRLERDGVPVRAALGNGPLRLRLVRQRADAAATGGIVLELTVDDARAAHRALRAAGLAPGPVQRQDQGVDGFALADPDGHGLAFRSAPLLVA